MWYLLFILFVWIWTWRNFQSECSQVCQSFSFSLFGYISLPMKFLIISVLVSFFSLSFFFFFANWQFSFLHSETLLESGIRKTFFFCHYAKDHYKIKQNTLELRKEPKYIWKEWKCIPNHLIKKTRKCVLLLRIISMKNVKLEKKTVNLGCFEI